MPNSKMDDLEKAKEPLGVHSEGVASTAQPGQGVLNWLLQSGVTDATLRHIVRNPVGIVSYLAAQPPKKLHEVCRKKLKPSSISNLISNPISSLMISS